MTGILLLIFYSGTFSCVAEYAPTPGLVGSAICTKTLSAHSVIVESPREAAIILFQRKESGKLYEVDPAKLTLREISLTVLEVKEAP